MSYRSTIFIALMSLFSSCSMSPMMSPSAFNAVVVGGNIQDVEAVYGGAFDIKALPGGMEERHYVQRIDLPSGAVEQTTYVFTVYEGRIVGKEKREERNSCHRYVE